jgi:hypothetical protein
MEDYIVTLGLESVKMSHWARTTKLVQLLHFWIRYPKALQQEQSTIKLVHVLAPLKMSIKTCSWNLVLHVSISLELSMVKVSIGEVVQYSVLWRDIFCFVYSNFFPVHCELNFWSKEMQNDRRIFFSRIINVVSYDMSLSQVLLKFQMIRSSRAPQLKKQQFFTLNVLPNFCPKNVQ